MPRDAGFGPASRLTLLTVKAEGASASFASDVRAGLKSFPKTLPPKYFYDELGSRLFEAICCLPEYYLTRAETEILATRAHEITQRTASNARLIELGSGNAEKTRYIIDAFLHRQTDLHYIPIDISADSLERSSKELLQVFPGLRITALAGDYFGALKCLREQGIPGGADPQNVFLFLGSNIGNFDPDQSLKFLGEIRNVARSGDLLLLGADLIKPASVLVPAYDDALGVTASFNLNLLVRINREFGGDFELSRFRHRAVYNEALSRMEMHLVSLEAQMVRISALDMEVRFQQGETIHTESSYKFDVDNLSKLARNSGFVLQEYWFDDSRRFSFNLMRAAEIEQQ
jgi:L-histidine N-alpha-methyltransferase